MLGWIILCNVISSQTCVTLCHCILHSIAPSYICWEDIMLHQILYIWRYNYQNNCILYNSSHITYIYISTYIYILHRVAYYTNLKRYDTNMFRNLKTISPTLRSSSDAVQAICCFQMAAKEATDAQALHTRRCGAWQASQRTREVDKNNVYSHSRSVFMPIFFARSKSIVYKIKI